MNTTEFEMYINDIRRPSKIRIEEKDELFYVSIDDDFKGSMKIDKSTESGFVTDDAELQQHLYSIASHLDADRKISELPEKLLERYGDNLVSFRFIENDTLELTAHEDTDIEEFGNVVEDLIYDDVEFEKKLTVIVRKENDEYTYTFDIN
ncbi:hypothetical protein [Pedobacter sp. Leaf170]|uniref:hypothetical protein n=1 Tax=Pedobacter sp. Leaf170 TaxID=2876558 RepID=UPI001E4A33F9|nr:hypothetical protein [Pedobacter sp. Leaf170]